MTVAFSKEKVCEMIKDYLNKMNPDCNLTVLLDIYLDENYYLNCGVFNFMNLDIFGDKTSTYDYQSLSEKDFNKIFSELFNEDGYEYSHYYCERNRVVFVINHNLQKRLVL